MFQKQHKQNSGLDTIPDLKYDATGEFYKARLMNYALGGGFNSRLNLNLREDKGWTYGARSGFTGDKYSGDFAFSSGIKGNATDSALSRSNERTERLCSTVASPKMR